MKIFVASWFFPPSTSSEGIVTYKLLRNSMYEYDVFSAESDLWGYKEKTDIKNAENITVYRVKTDDIDEWKKACVEKFESLYDKKGYSCIMTRSMPPESISVGSMIKERHPEIKWIASLADPIANNPYEIDAYVEKNSMLSKEQKIMLKRALRAEDESALSAWESHPMASIRLLCKLKKWENIVLREADLIICPTAEQIRYMLGKKHWNPKCVPIPHSFDPTFYSEEQGIDDGKMHFLFIGYSDQTRSLEPIIKAIRRLKESRSAALDEMQVDIVGNNPRNLKDQVLNYYLDDIIFFHEGVNYYQSLKWMQNADWLIHIDAFFDELAPCGSIFFAGKLADYFGTDKPIFALTGEGTPADEMVRLAGGISLRQGKIASIASAFEKIVLNKDIPMVHRGFRDLFSAQKVSSDFDSIVGGLIHPEIDIEETLLPKEEKNNYVKFLTICVPAFNVERCLSRCLKTLLDHPYVKYEEILIIDDGSTDLTREIAQGFEKRYSGIVKLISKKNGGHGSAINMAIHYATGKYFKVVDSDDWVDSAALGELIRSIKENIFQEDIISSNYEEIDLNTGAATMIAPDESVEFDRSYHFAELSPEKYYFTLASMTIRTGILREHHIRLQENTYYVDCEYILFPIPHVRKFLFSNDSLYRYSRGSTEQSVDLDNLVMRYDHHNRVVHSLLKHSLEMIASKEQRAYYDAILLKIIKTHYALMLIYDKKKDRGFRRAKEFDIYLKRIRPDIYDRIKKKMPLTRIVQLGRYSDKSTVYRLWQIAEREHIVLKTRSVALKERMLHSGLFQRALYNPVTRTIYRIHFVQNGYRKYIKKIRNEVSE